MKLAAERITVVRQGRRVVLHDIDCELAPGRLVGILGPNGAGKSTLLKALAGLLPLGSGRVVLEGRDLVQIERGRLARSIAYLPQECSVHWPLAVRDIVALGRLPHRTGPTSEGPADRKAIEAAIATMDLTHLADRQTDRISGGELARTLIARALAQEARVILADEPVAGLDPAHAIDLFGVLRTLTAERRTVAVALHDLTFAARYCDDVLVLSAGRVAVHGTAATVLQSEHLNGVFGVEFVTGNIDGWPVVLPTAPRH